MANVVLERAPLGFPWATVDPFLFCAYHNDAYPKGNGALGPDRALLRGRNLGMDFEIKDGFRMYHGRDVPGFPVHPHRGFETLTLVRRGYCDHSDSLGGAARFGAGDAQWVTAGAGIQHSEMFPLLSDDHENPLELFQIWVNLPSDAKMAPPAYSIVWSQQMPRIVRTDSEGRKSVVRTVVGSLDGHPSPATPPDSWSSRPGSDVQVWTIEMEAGAQLTLPAARAGTHRALYFFDGDSVSVGGTEFKEHSVLLLEPTADVELVAGAGRVGLLLLGGKPIAQPVAQHGPFVMNTRAQLEQAFSDYQKTRFGGWPWPNEAPNHGKSAGRFAVYPNGAREEFPLAPSEESGA